MHFVTCPKNPPIHPKNNNEQSLIFWFQCPSQENEEQFSFSFETLTHPNSSKVSNLNLEILFHNSKKKENSPSFCFFSWNYNCIKLSKLVQWKCWEADPKEPWDPPGGSRESHSRSAQGRQGRPWEPPEGPIEHQQAQERLRCSESF